MSNAAQSARERVLAVAAKLLAEGGREAVSTRAVSAAADIQAPTLYRLFGDKQGLLDAVAIEGINAYVESKAQAEACTDPVEDLRRGWDHHVSFGLDNPALYSLVYGERRAASVSPAALAGREFLAARIRRIAQAGRLRVDEERAAHLVHATGSGTTLTLIAMPEESRDMSISDLAREAVIAAIVTETPVTPAANLVGAAVALRARLGETPVLSPQERGLLREWLERIAREGT